MRIVESESGKKFVVRSLTTGEIRTLLKNGFGKNSGFTDLDMLLEMALNENEYRALDGMPHKFTLKVFDAAIKESFGDEIEEKNLSRSGNGSQTESE